MRLAVTKKDLFYAASLGAYLDIISSVINTQLVPQVVGVERVHDAAAVARAWRGGDDRLGHAG